MVCCCANAVSNGYVSYPVFASPKDKRLGARLLCCFFRAWLLRAFLDLHCAEDTLCFGKATMQDEPGARRNGQRFGIDTFDTS